MSCMRRVTEGGITLKRFCWLCVVAFGLTAVLGGDPNAYGQEGRDAATDLRWFDHFVVAGGGITWAILLPLSVATIWQIVLYGISIRRTNLLPLEAEEHAAKLLSQKKYAEAVRFTAEDPSVLAYVLNAAMGEANRGFVAMERALEESLEERSAKLHRKIEYLNVIGNIAPMVGLFGTVYGMIRLFASIKAAGSIPEPAKIADDISIALVTTFWGLAVAIPALSAFAIFRNRIDVLMADCAIVCERLLDSFKPGGESAGQEKKAETGEQSADLPTIPVA